MNIVERPLDSVRPYENNPRRNAGAVDATAESIRLAGFKQPIVIDRDGVIVCGHTRHLAAKKLGLETVPCVLADDLTPEQVKAYRLIDNKTHELSEWDVPALEEELAAITGIDMEAFGFDLSDLEPLDLDDSGDEGGNGGGKTCTCPKCGFEFAP